MPFFGSYVIYGLVPPTPLPPGSSIGAGFGSETSQLLCNAEMYEAEHFLALFDKLMPQEYLYPLKVNPDSGYEIYHALAAVGERVSLAAERSECGLTIVFADSGSYAEVDLRFTRPTVDAGAFTQKAGTLLTTSNGNRQFELIEDAVFGALDLGPITARARAVAVGYEYNVPGVRVSAGGETLHGEIDTIEMSIQDPPYADTTVEVAQVDDATGGTADWLQGHGASRGLTRAAGETADQFRLRIRTIPDAVTPAAFRRLAERVLGAAGIGYEIIETWQIDYQTCWDAPSPNTGTPTYDATANPNPLFDDTLFTYDDPRGTETFANRWLDLRDYRGCTIVVVDIDSTLHDYGFALDDSGTTAASFSNGRLRGTPAFDVTVSPSSVVNVAAFDGDDELFNAAVAALYVSLQEAKAAGTAAVVEFKHLW